MAFPGYWKRCCKERWEICDVSAYGGCWKRMYFEKNLQKIIENFVPESTDSTELYDTLPLSANYVKRYIYSTKVLKHIFYCDVPDRHPLYLYNYCRRCVKMMHGPWWIYFDKIVLHTSSSRLSKIYIKCDHECLCYNSIYYLQPECENWAKVITSN